MFWQNIFPFCQFLRRVDRLNIETHKPQRVNGIAPSFRILSKPSPAPKVNGVSIGQRQMPFPTCSGGLCRQDYSRANILRFKKLRDEGKTTLSLLPLRGLDCFEAIKETLV